MSKKSTKTESPAPTVEELAQTEKERQEAEERQAALRAFFEGQRRGQAGRPQNVPDGFRVVSIIPADCEPAHANRIRNRLRAQQAQPDLDEVVTVPGLEAAEVWLMREEDFELRRQLRRERHARRVAALQRKAKSRNDLNGKPLEGADINVLQQMRQ